jgi:acetyl esterase/lipase
LAWTAQYARSIGADAGKLVVTGDSAGGNLALQLGWSASAGAAESSCPQLGSVPVPDAVVTGYPVADPSDTYEHGHTWFFGQNPRDFTREYIGGKPADYPDRMASISPETYLSSSIPPTLIVQPGRDDFIPAPGNRDLAAKAEVARADVSVIEVPFTHHAFDALTGSIGGQVKLTSAQSWLESKGLAASR